MKQEDLLVEHLITPLEFSGVMFEKLRATAWIAGIYLHSHLQSMISIFCSHGTLEYDPSHQIYQEGAD